MSNMMIAEMPACERPRERLLEFGAGALSNAELLAILLRTGNSEVSAVGLARILLDKFGGDLSQLVDATVSELQELKGIGVAKAVEINAAFALANRLSKIKGKAPLKLASPLSVVDYMRETFRGKRQEEFHVLFLDTKNGLLKDNCITVGLLDRSLVHAREVFRLAVREAAAKILLVHNHPTGDPTPSSQDLQCTRKLIEAGKVIGIEVVDHVVIGTVRSGGSREYVSLREDGLVVF